MTINKPQSSTSDLISDLSEHYDLVAEDPLCTSGSYGDDILELQALIGKIVNILEQQNILKEIK